MLICCLVFAGVQAQKITRDYNNVSLSEALRQLNEETEEYTISFLYNELEDFRITTSVHHKTIPEAIRQMIGFYPIRMTIEPGIANPSQQEIIVECPQKSAPRYKGTIIDEQGQPVAYANIALLSPQDSTLITGGVSNESGFFVIPCEQKPVLARISYVGYKTIYKQCNNTELGTIRMQPETQTLKGVTVKGERPMYQTIALLQMWLAQFWSVCTAPTSYFCKCQVLLPHQMDLCLSLDVELLYTTSITARCRTYKKLAICHPKTFFILSLFVILAYNTMQKWKPSSR